MQNTYSDTMRNYQSDSSEFVDVVSFGLEHLHRKKRGEGEINPHVRKTDQRAILLSIPTSFCSSSLYKIGLVSRLHFSTYHLEFHAPISHCEFFRVMYLFGHVRATANSQQERRISKIEKGEFSFSLMKPIQNSNIIDSLSHIRFLNSFFRIFLHSQPSQTYTNKKSGVLYLDVAT